MVQGVPRSKISGAPGDEEWVGHRRTRFFLSRAIWRLVWLSCSQPILFRRRSIQINTTRAYQTASHLGPGRIHTSASGTREARVQASRRLRSQSGDDATRRLSCESEASTPRARPTRYGDLHHVSCGSTDSQSGDLKLEM
jgi:hypothetical protein